MQFTIKGQVLSLDAPVTVAETQKYLTASFSFSEDWAGITEKVLHYEKDGRAFDKAIVNDAIAEADNFQLSEGKWKLYIHGVNADFQRITTTAVYLDVKPFGSFAGEVYPNVPQHVIDELLVLIQRDGDGSLFLSNDGTYKAATASTEAIAQAVEEYLSTHPVTAAWETLSGSFMDNEELAQKMNSIDSDITRIEESIPEDLSELQDDATHRTVTDAEKTAWDNKQNALVSGTNIKTINGESVLGSGNIVISGGGGAVDSVNGKTGAVVLNASDVGALPSDTPLFSGSYNDLSNKPTLFSGDYNDLTNKPTIPSISGLASEAYVDNAIQTAIGNAIGGVY